jgi:hypothetical protein
MAHVEASVTSASGADGSVCASIVARKLLALLFETLEESLCPGDGVGPLTLRPERS